MTAKAELVAYLENVCIATPGLEDVRVIPAPREIDDLSGPVLIVKTDSYGRLEEAPSRIAGFFTLTLVSPHKNIVRADQDLDERLEVLLPMLRTAGLLFDTATQVGYGEKNLAADITLKSILS